MTQRGAKTDSCLYDGDSKTIPCFRSVDMLSWPGLVPQPVLVHVVHGFREDQGGHNPVCEADHFAETA